MSDIKIGDYISFPKGTPIHWNGNGHYVTPRKMTKRITEVVTERQDVVLRLLTDDERNQVRRYASDQSKMMEYRAAERSFLASISDAVLARHPGKTPCIVAWNDGEGVLIDDAVKVDPPAPKVKPLTKMQQMVPKSVWRVTETIDVHVTIGNAAYAQESGRQWEIINAIKGMGWQDRSARHAEHMRASGLKETIELAYVRLVEGTEIVVSGKRTNSAYFGPDWNHRYEGGSFLYPFKVPKAGSTWLSKIRHKDMFLPYDRIADHIEAVTIPQVRLWAMRDRETGKFFKDARPAAYGADRTGTLDMVGSYHEARKYKDLGLVKTSILDWCGYYDGLPENVMDGRPAWMTYGYTGKIADLPSTFEAVCFDKHTKQELPEVESDLQDWYERLWKLRHLTINYGSIVRKLYNDIDKKGEVDQFSYILALRTPLDERYNYVREFTQDEIAAFEDVIERSGLGRKDMRRGRNDHSMAVAVRDANIAFQMRMFYGGPLKMAVLNMRTLEEESR